MERRSEITGLLCSDQISSPEPCRPGFPPSLSTDLVGSCQWLRKGLITWDTCVEGPLVYSLLPFIDGGQLLANVGWQGELYVGGER